MATSAAPLRFDRSLTEALAGAGPPLLFALRLWASVCLALFVALPGCGWVLLAADDGRSRPLEFHGIPEKSPSGSLTLGPDGSLTYPAGDRADAALASRL